MLGASTFNLVAHHTALAKHSEREVLHGVVGSGPGGVRVV